MTTCYNFIDIKLASEKIQARPTGWDREIYDGFGNDKNGNPAIATEFEATCPYCGNLVQFSKGDIFKDSLEDDNIKCTSCNKGNKAVGQEVVVETQVLPEFQPKKQVFIDPIESGLFDIDVDIELLKKVESAESN